jgi:hypothetical protein
MTAQRARRAFAPTATPAAPEPTPVAVQAAPVSEPAAAPPAPRTARKPFGSHVQKLSYPERPGFHRHWFNDTPGRIARAEEAGYTHVKTADGRNVARIMGVGEGGGALNGYLMEIPLEWYREDQALKDAKRDEIDAKLRRGIVAGVAPGQDGAYLPTNKSGTTGPDVKMHGK